MPQKQDRSRSKNYQKNFNTTKQGNKVILPPNKVMVRDIPEYPPLKFKCYIKLFNVSLKSGPTSKFLGMRSTMRKS